MKPLRLRRRVVHTIGLPYHWGGIGRVRGDVTNELIAFVGDPNVSIQESKALTANIVPGRRARGRRAATAALGAGAPRFTVEAARDLPGVGQKTPQPPEIKK
jgi:formate dehydrogenase major subunit